MVTRRAFLKSSGISLIGIGLLGGIPAFAAEAVAQEKSFGLNKRKVIVCVFQRGAMDGLMAVTPFEDSFLKQARPELFIDVKLKSEDNGLIDLDGRYGLHPSMKAFESVFRDKRLAIVHGIGSPNTTRSHFDAQDYMESGTPFSKNTTSGWLNRASGLMGHEHPTTPFSAVSITSALPRSLYGDNEALAINDLRNFKIQGSGAVLNQNAKSFEELYEQTTDQLLSSTGRESFEAMKILQSNLKQQYKPANGAVYPNSNLGKSLQQVAQLIKMNVGLEVAFTESNGWDTHFNQGQSNGIFARNVEDLSSSIMAFWNDIEAFQDDVLLMTMTEFGRTVHQNGTKGTDHGRASCNFILGNDVKGGLVYGKMDPLSNENLEDGRDLKVTTDFRSVFSEVASKHLKIKDNRQLFPDWNGHELGLMNS